jgi:hypothetical protein
MKRSTVTKAKPVFTQIWFLIEGRGVRFRCEHHAGWFRLGNEERGQTKVTCSYGKEHRVMSGFYLESPVPIEEPEWCWVGHVIRGIQLPLAFPARAWRIGRVTQ